MQAFNYSHIHSLLFVSVHWREERQDQLPAPSSLREDHEGAQAELQGKPHWREDPRFRWPGHRAGVNKLQTSVLECYESDHYLASKMIFFSCAPYLVMKNAFIRYDRKCTSWWSSLHLGITVQPWWFGYNNEEGNKILKWPAVHVVRHRSVVVHCGMIGGSILLSLIAERTSMIIQRDLKVVYNYLISKGNAVNIPWSAIKLSSWMSSISILWRLKMTCSSNEINDLLLLSKQFL